MLPNTKKLSDKWWKFFEGLLLVYPIAGLLVGAGDYISRLLLKTSDGFFSWITAMVVGIVPIFFIPMVLKGSFAAMGKVGGMLTGLGAVASKRATGAAKGSEAYKGLQARSLERRTRLRAGVDKNGNVRELGKLGVLARGGRRRVAAARANYDKTQADRIREDMWMDPQYSANRAMYRKTAANTEREKMYGDLFASRNRPDNQAELKNALAGDDPEKASAALSTLVKQGGITEALGELMNADWDNMDEKTRGRLEQTMASSGVDAMQSYAKYRTTGGKASFSDWATGNISTAQRATEAAAGVKDVTYAQHLLDGGEKAMTRYTKDEVQFVQRNANTIRQAMEEQAVASGKTAEDGRNEFGAMLKTTAINSGDAKAQTIAENTMADQLASGALNVDNLGITTSDIGDMRGSMAEAVRDGVARKELGDDKKWAEDEAARNAARAAATNKLRNNEAGSGGLKTQIDGAKADPMVGNRMKVGTRNVFIDIPRPPEGFEGGAGI